METTKKKATRKRKPKPKLVGTKAFSARGQDHDLRSRYELAGHRLKVSVHLDAGYRFQHRLKAFVWREADLTWQTVATMHHSEAPRVRYSAPQPDRPALLEVEQELLKRAAWALGVK